MQEKHSKKTALSPKKRTGDIPTNSDIGRTLGEAPTASQASQESAAPIPSRMNRQGANLPGSNWISD